MVITRTPFRISFFGGGTDYPVHYRKHGGSVLSTTIDKYCYIHVRYLPPLWEHNYRIRYTDREETMHIHEIRHPSVRACLDDLGFHRHRLEIQHNSDLPATAGLGASSSFTTGLIQALHALRGNALSKEELARESIRTEQEVMKEHIGSQDQVAVAYGGFNRIDFSSSGEIRVSPVSAAPGTLDALESRLLLVFSGQHRIASHIAKEQIENSHTKEVELSRMHEMVHEGENMLSSGVGRLDDFGRLLHESWQIKRTLTSKITNQEIDGMYETARRAGALGGKVLGAGGGGFMLFYAPPDRVADVKSALAPRPVIPFRFDDSGSTVIYQKESNEYLI